MWTLNEKEYFEAPGRSAHLFQDRYREGKQGGLELVRGDLRIATNGDMRLEPAPGQWSSLSEAGERKVIRGGASPFGGGCVEQRLSFPKEGIAASLRLSADGEDLVLALELDESFSPDKTPGGRLSLGIDLLPGDFRGSGYAIGGVSGILPELGNGGRPVPGCSAGASAAPGSLGRGRHLVLAPEAAFRRVDIVSTTGEIELIDGRDHAANGWFVATEILADGARRAEWRIRLAQDPAWRHGPVIGISQGGYHPGQKKVAVIEMDARLKTEAAPSARLERLDTCLAAADSGTARNRDGVSVLDLPVGHWGDFLRYHYVTVDFSVARETGLYRLSYMGKRSEPFVIAKDAHDRGLWQPTLETFLPAQMCHMEVRDGSRCWHGACHLSDALQAPAPHEHFDGYRQYEGTDTQYSPGSPIPHCDEGGWHDAGDYDLATGSQAQTTYFLALAREEFGLSSDRTSVDFQKRFVRLHAGDGIPDIVEQVKQGVLALLAGYRASGHAFMGIIEASIGEYAYIGDAANMHETRWAFTNRSAALEYQCSGTLAAAARVLRGFDDALASECLSAAVTAWERERRDPSPERRAAYVPWSVAEQKVFADSELFILTGEERFLRALEADFAAITERKGDCLSYIAHVIDHLRVTSGANADTGGGDASGAGTAGTAGLTRDFLADVEKVATDHSDGLRERLAANPWGLPLHRSLWGQLWSFQAQAVKQYFLVKTWPALFDVDMIHSTVAWALGRRMGDDRSLVTGVGSKSVMVAYGTNRAEPAGIAGGVVSGPNVVEPDLPEYQYPFNWLWQQAEYVIGGAASWVFCVLASRECARSAAGTLAGEGE